MMGSELISTPRDAASSPSNVCDASIHAAGVVISEGPLTDHVPLYKGANDEIVTQYSMGDVEKIGLVKFDFLGLKTLTMIRRAETSAPGPPSASRGRPEIPLCEILQAF